MFVVILGDRHTRPPSLLPIPLPLNDALRIWVSECAGPLSARSGDGCAGRGVGVVGRGTGEVGSGMRPGGGVALGRGMGMVGE